MSDPSFFAKDEYLINEYLKPCTKNGIAKKIKNGNLTNDTIETDK